VICAAVVAAALAPSGLVGRFADPLSGDARARSLPSELAAAQALSPVGSGLGSYAEVFLSVEPLETLDRSYMNHAHNDYVEVWIETGWLGPLIIAGFFGWFAVRAVSIWRLQPIGTAPVLAMAGSIVIALLLLHSILDYPLRTPTVAGVFAFACALLARPSALRARAGRGRTSEPAAAAPMQADPPAMV
jgi:hypothetical protein